MTQIQEMFGQRSLKQRKTDAQVTIGFNSIHGLGDVPPQAYIEHPLMQFSVNIPFSLGLCNRLPLDTVVLNDL